jgi:hypothetical protein
MAKVKGPLFSISASGTIADTATYRATARGAIAQMPPIPRTAANANQRRERARFELALVGWQSLDATARAEWAAAGLAFGMAAHKLYTKAYITQQCTGTEIPLIPAKN